MIARLILRAASVVPAQIWASLAVVMLLGVSVGIINNRAYNRGFAEAERQWQIRVAEELARQEAANQEALRIAQEEVARLNEARRVRDATIERLLREAQEDPDAARPALGTGSVRRLNSVVE